METPRSNKRAQLVEAAGNLVHRRGFNRTTLADIAEESGIRLGNVYYYFKTKAAIGEAIVEQRASDYRALLGIWDKLPAAEDRLEAFIQFTCESRAILARSGCPIGSFCSELQKGETPWAEKAAHPFAVLLRWIEAQFITLGKARQKKALALHLLAALEGVSLLAHSFGDPELVALEANHLKRWIDTL